MRHVIFSYKVKDLQQEVEKRTSYLGKMRSDGNNQHLLNRLSLTEGEDFLFNEYIQEATAEVYNWIKPFCRNIVDAYRIDFNEVHTVYENYGVKLLHQKVLCQNGQTTLQLTDDNSSVQLNDTETTNEKQVVDIAVDLSSLSVVCGQADEVKVQITLTFTKMDINDHDNIEEQTYVEEQIFVYDDALKNLSLKLETPATDPMRIDELKQVDIVVSDISANGEDLLKGDVIEYVYLTGNKSYMRLLLDATDEELTNNNFHYELLNDDAYGKVIYHLAVLDWQDENTFPRVDRLIRETIVHYVIWRWFETVNPQESDYYRKRWEEYAHELQLALNTEKQPLKRRYNWYAS